MSVRCACSRETITSRRGRACRSELRHPAALETSPHFLRDNANLRPVRREAFLKAPPLPPFQRSHIRSTAHSSRDGHPRVANTHITEGACSHAPCTASSSRPQNLAVLPLSSCAVLAFCAATLALPLSSQAAEALAQAELAAQAADAAVQAYVPGPVEVGWQIYVGALVGAFPFVLGSWEFGKRILIQRRCGTCEGIGLVKVGKYYKKCRQCGGFFPWLGWKTFWTSTASPGNGGPLLQPRGQTSVLYKVPPLKPEAVKQNGAEDQSEAAAERQRKAGTDAAVVREE